jgi:uncharacterized protein YvpB
VGDLPASSQAVREQVNSFYSILKGGAGVVLGNVDLDVPAVCQGPELPTGCEVTAVTMMLQYAGCDVTKTQMADAMPRSTDDYDEGFIGDPYESDFSTPYYPTIYPPAFKDLVTDEVGSFKDLTGAGAGGLIAALDVGKPVVCWVTSGGGTHAVCVCGYDQGDIIYNDPGDGTKNNVQPVADFMERWGEQSWKALTY